MNSLLHKIPEIIRHFQSLVIRRHISISRYTDIIRFRHFVLRKYQVQMLQDDLFHTNVSDIMSRKAQNVRHELWHRNNAHHTFVIHLQTCRYIQFFIQKMRKWMIRIHNLRGKNRKNLIFKIKLYILLLLGFQFFIIKSTHSIRMQFFLNLSISLIALFI